MSVENKKNRKSTRGRDRSEFEVTPFGRKLRRSRGAILLGIAAAVIYPIGVVSRWFRSNRTPRAIPVPIRTGPLG